MSRTRINIFLLLVCIILSSQIKAQAFISDVFEETIVIGPDNVLYLDSLLCKAYINEIEILQDELLAYQMENTQEIEKLTSKKFVWNGNKLQELQQLDGKIEHELSLIKRIVHAWERSLVHFEIVQRLKHYNPRDSCLIIRTQQNNFFMSELKLDSTLIPLHKRANNREEISSVITAADEQVWVKKIDPSCISSDPEDCLIYCLVDRPGFYKVEMIGGGTYDWTNIPQDFDIIEGQISRPALYHEIAETHSYTIVESRYGTVLELIGWKNDCD